MTDEELLEKALHEYPIGTVVNPVSEYGISDTTYTIPVKPYIYRTPQCWIIAGVNVYCPLNKLWAKIISTPRIDYPLWI